MGYMCRHAIVVTDHGYDDFLDKAHEKAFTIFPWVSPISPPQMNHERSFFIPPDGSKEGRAESEIGDIRRDVFVTYLHSIQYEDGSSPLSWVEVQFGDDDGHVTVVRSDRDRDDQLATEQRSTQEEPAGEPLECSIDAFKRERERGEGN